MDPERYAQKMIDEAIASGELEPTVGVGEPLGPLRNDPDWWVRAFLEREHLPERRAEVVAHIEGIVARAIRVDDLASARTLLAEANRDVERWNAGAPAAFHITGFSEIWLLTQRAQTPGPSGPGVANGH